MEEYLTPGAIDFIKCLMDYDPSKRLGLKDASDIKSHEFFKDIDWNNICNMKPPFIPEVQNEIDTTFFSNDK